MNDQQAVEKEGGNPNANAPPTNGCSLAKKVCREKLSILRDLVVLKKAIPKFDLYSHDPTEWVSIVKRATEDYESPKEILNYLHSFFKQSSMLTWYITVKLSITDLDILLENLKKKAHEEMVKAHKLADLQFDEYLKEIKYTGTSKLEEFIKSKLLLFADLYSFFPKEAAHEKVFYQMGSTWSLAFMPYRQDDLKVILEVAKVWDNVNSSANS